MKKITSIFILAFLSLYLSSCSMGEGTGDFAIKSPINNDLQISGIWSIEKYDILDNNLYNEDNVRKILSDKIIIQGNSITLADKVYKGSNYKLMVVKKDYLLSYEVKYSIENLESYSEYTDIYCIMYQDNLLGEFIYYSKDKSYFYYGGVLFYLSYDKEVEEEEIVEANIRGASKEEVTMEEESVVDEGILIGLKTPMANDEDTHVRESYRTLWISFKNSEFSYEIKENEIIIPRSSGMWSLKPELYEDSKEDIYYEYFDANGIDTKEKRNNTSSQLELLLSLKSGSKIYKSINYIGTNYIAVEISNNNISNNISNYYDVLPIDNLYLEDGIVIGDIYENKDINKIYKESYDDVYNSLDESIKKSISKYIDYGNFTLARNNGKWVLQSMISGLNNNESIEYSLGIKPNEKLVTYDTLYIPWKSIKSQFPFVNDAYISTNAQIAVLLNDDEIAVYLIENGSIDEQPRETIKLNEGEEVIMAEWCENEYVSNWEGYFKNNNMSNE